MYAEIGDIKTIEEKSRSWEWKGCGCLSLPLMFLISFTALCQMPLVSIMCKCRYILNDLIMVFYQVYVEALSKADLLFITQALYPQINQDILEKMVTFNQQVNAQYCILSEKNGVSSSCKRLIGWGDSLI